LEYVCRARKVKVAAVMPDDPRNVHAWVDGVAVPYKQLAQVNGQRCLPNYIFGYYSGPSNRMKEHFEKHQERFYRDLLDGKDQPLRPLFYARPIHSQFVLLAFFLKQEDETKQFLHDHLWIEGLDSVLFVMNEPPWKSREGDERFWKARGTVSQFLDRLYGLALAPLRLKQRVTAGFRKTTTREHLYLYLKDVDALRGLADIRRLVTEADRYFQKYDAGDGIAREAFENTVRALRERLSAAAEYSATARAMLMGLRGAHPVVGAVLAA
jgi:hypothetical protein